MLVIRSESRLALVYPAIGAVVVLVASTYLLLGAMLHGRPDGLLRTIAFLVLGLGLIYGGVGVAWWYSAGRTAYICDGELLTATRGDKVIHSVRCRDISDMTLGPPMTRWDLFWDILMGMPRLELEVKDAAGGVHRIGFPPILIWGEEPLHTVEARLRTAVQAGPSD